MVKARGQRTEKERKKERRRRRRRRSEIRAWE